MKVGDLYAVDLQMCLLSVVRSTTGTPSGNLKRKIMFQIHFLQLSPQHWPESVFYPNIKALVTILCNLPVTSCTAKRSFSGLKCIKTVLRSSMSDEHLSSLTLLHMHHDIPIDIEKVIDEFSRSFQTNSTFWRHSIAISSLCCFIFSY